MNRFGSIDVVGQTVTAVRRGEQQSLRVTGVFEDIPRNSHMNFRAVGRHQRRSDKAECGWGCVNGFVYLKLRPGADAGADQSPACQAWERRNIPPRDVGGQQISEGDLFDWRLVNVRDVHLSGAEGELERPGNDRRTIVTFAIVALLILGHGVDQLRQPRHRARQPARPRGRAAQGARRPPQAAHRPVPRRIAADHRRRDADRAGAGRARPSLSVGLPQLGPDDPAISAPTASCCRCSACSSSSAWPAASIRPSICRATSRRRCSRPTSRRPRRRAPAGCATLLVVAQFAVSIGLIVCTIVVYAQTRFAQTTDLGFQREGLIQVANMNRAAVAAADRDV